MWYLENLVYHFEYPRDLVINVCSCIFYGNTDIEIISMKVIFENTTTDLMTKLYFLFLVLIRFIEPCWSPFLSIKFLLYLGSSLLWYSWGFHLWLSSILLNDFTYSYGLTSTFMSITPKSLLLWSTYYL